MLDASNFEGKKIGIQGGKGSFNETALQMLMKEIGVKNYEIVHLFTTENVLNALDRGEIAFGNFAIHNTLGGPVEESETASKNHQFEVLHKYQMQIKHNLMKLPETPIDKLTTVMAHPQVLRQCSKTLSLEYPHLQQVSGEGEFLDTAKAAEALSKNLIPNTTAILGNPIIADILELETIDTNLQDNDENFTSFVLVKQQQVTVGVY